MPDGVTSRKGDARRHHGGCAGWRGRLLFKMNANSRLSSNVTPTCPTASALGETFDAVVFGAGYIGAGAVSRLLKRGLNVLVVDFTGQLLWETSRALENRIDLTGDKQRPEWRLWVERMTNHGAVRNDCVDGAFAEIDTARRWLQAVEQGTPKGGRLQVLFYAMPVGCGKDGAVRFATKNGLRDLRARWWLDASEEGSLAICCGTVSRPHAQACETFHGMALHSGEWKRHEEAVRAFCEERGAELRLSARDGERRLVWRTGDRKWYREVVELMAGLRERFELGAEMVVSHCAMEPFPIWRGMDSTLQNAVTAVKGSMCMASPALHNVGLASIGGRFEWGAQCAEALFQGQDTERTFFPGEGGVVPVRTHICDVLVTGAGTAGALAAIAARREGADTRVLDLASFPGGVGTGAAISGYFHGAEGGGLQAEIDARVAEINVLLEGERGPARRWHHEGRKIALLEFFEREQVEFHGEALLFNVERDDNGRVNSAMVATRSGVERFEARAFVDSSGDGDLCALAGAEFICGRPGDGRSLAFSQSALVLREGSQGATERKMEVFARNFDAGWVDATEVEALSRARLLGVAQHWQADWSGPDCPLAVAALPGIRQSRSIVTDYMVTLADLVMRRHFDDGVCLVKSIADTHSVDFEFESDEAVFYFWACRLARLPLVVSLPYRAMLASGLSNVWIACRAVGLDATATYAARMQRDMQRLGVVAGVAAAMALRTGGRGESRKLSIPGLRARLDSINVETGGREACMVAEMNPGEAAEALVTGQPGIHVWRIAARPDRYRSLVESALESTIGNVSFYAAAILAMWSDAEAEDRLIEAIENRESGPPPSKENTGAYGQEIDVPFWLLSVALLRRCGTQQCVNVLARLAKSREALCNLNTRASIALTTERLATGGRIGVSEATMIIECVVSQPLPDDSRWLAPSRSIWRALRGEPQLVLRNDCGVDTRQDHQWQLEMVVRRMAAFMSEKEAATCI